MRRSMDRCETLFQSTLSMRRATIPDHGQRDTGRISIHALHEESDPRGVTHDTQSLKISIHALHEESDRTPTRSLRRGRYFNPRSP